MLPSNVSDFSVVLAPPLALKLRHILHKRQLTVLCAKKGIL